MSDNASIVVPTSGRRQIRGDALSTHMCRYLVKNDGTWNTPMTAVGNMDGSSLGVLILDVTIPPTP